MSDEALALVDNLSTAALLRDAIGVLRARGLAIDTFALDPGDGTPADQWPVCAVGAIAVADGGKPHQYEDPRITRALLAINRCFPMLAVDEDDVLVHDALAKELMLAIGRWNDSVADVEEIIEVFECTAAALDAAEAPGIPPARTARHRPGRDTGRRRAPHHRQAPTPVPAGAAPASRPGPARRRSREPRRRAAGRSRCTPPGGRPPFRARPEDPR